MLHVDLISDCERDFVRSTISQDKRVDGRSSKDSRPVHIEYGLDRGCCIVSLGQTKVMAQVSCEITAPKASRANEGQLFVNFELSPMAAPNFEPGRLGDYGVEVSRLLERCIRDSHCVDTESLCLVAGEKVWGIRVDVQVMNHDGNVCECANIAVIAALLHFRRPEVSMVGTDITVHDPRDREPVPVHLHHHPFCMSFAFYEAGEAVLADPTELEEKIADGILTVGANGRQEVCVLHQRGCIMRKEQVLLCVQLAGVRAKSLSEIIKAEIKKDEEVRNRGEPVGFAARLTADTPLVMTGELPAIDIDQVEEIQVIEESGTMSKVLSDVKVFLEGVGTAAIGKGGPSSWDVLDGDDDAEHTTKKATRKNRRDKSAISINDESSEEEEVSVLQGEGFPGKHAADDSGDVDLTSATKDQNRGWYSREPF